MPHANKNEIWNKKYGLPQSACKPKARMGKLTIPDRIEDLLCRDDVNEVLAELDKKKPDIKDMIVIYMDKSDGKRYYISTKNLQATLATWMLETVKSDILEDNNDEEKG